MNRILRVNMTELTVKYEELPEKYAMLGGRALTSALIADEVPPGAHPLGENNKLVFAPGLLSGTNAPSSGRMSVGAKSPLTGTIKESNAGGITSQKLASLGLRAVVVEGRPTGDDFRLLVINEDGAELVPAEKLIGTGCYRLNTELWEDYGTKSGVISIGPAGEMRMLLAGISTNDREGGPGRYAGRGGLGAVMGSKGLKAILVRTDKTFDAPVKDRERFKEAARKLSKALTEHPVSGQALPTYGTAVLVNILNEAGGFPTRNFRQGQFEGAAKTSGEAIAELVKQRGGAGRTGHACHPGCVIRCSNIIPDAEGKALCSPLEYESVWSLGANCGIDNLDHIATLNRLCNDIGVDTIETGVTLGVLMEAGVLAFGDGKAAIALLDYELRKGTPLGRILGSGSALAGKLFGLTRVPTVKGQGMPAYDPRAVKGIGVTYATSTMGADHTAGYSVTANILKVGGFVDPLQPEGQIELSRNLQVATAAVDAAGLCLFSAFALLDNEHALPCVAEMLNAQYGTSLTVANIMDYGKEILKTERAFNEAAGFTEAHDRLPEFMKLEKLPPHQVIFDVPDAEMDQTLKFDA